MASMYKDILKKILYTPFTLVISYLDKKQFKTVTKDFTTTDIFTHYTMPYIPQRNAKSWRSFGWAKRSDYDFLSVRICAIACLSMIIRAVTKQKPTLKTLTEKGLVLSGYTLYNQQGKFVDQGWFHHPLIQLADEYGLLGITKKYISPERACLELLAGKLVILSGDAYTFGAGQKRPKNVPFSSHQVVLVGFRQAHGVLTGMYYHNPSGEGRALTQNAYLPIEIFRSGFNFRALVFRRKTNLIQK